MPTRVFLTVDTELMWRHHTAGLDAATIVERSLEPAGVGVAWQLAELGKHGLKVARRTVTKYRQAMNILSSRQRRTWTDAPKNGS